MEFVRGQDASLDATGCASEGAQLLKWASSQNVLMVSGSQSSSHERTHPENPLQNIIGKLAQSEVGLFDHVQNNDSKLDMKFE